MLLNKFLNLKLRVKILISYILIIFFSIGVISIIAYKIYESDARYNAIVYSNNLVNQFVSNISYKAKDFEDNVLLEVRMTNSFPETARVSDLPLSIRYRDLIMFAKDLTFSKAEVSEFYAEDIYMKGYYYNKEKETDDVETSDLYKYVDKNRTEIKGAWGTPIWTSFRSKPGIIYMVRAVYSTVSSKYLGIIAVGIDENYFTSLISDLYSSDKGKIFIFNGNGDILSGETASIPVAEHFKNLTNIKMENVYEKFQKQNYLVSTGMSIDKKWEVIYIISSQDLLREVNRIRYWIFVACLASIVVALIIAIFISGNITSNVRLLLNKIRLIEQGNFSTEIKPTSYDEIGQLAVEFNSMAGKLKELINKITLEHVEKEKAEYKALQAEYNALQAQMNPHFLYNTLETLNSYAKVNHQKEAELITTSLGKLLRSSISNKHPIITLEAEIEYVKNYLFIQIMALGDRIQVEFDIDENVLQYRVPKLILQPIVENAIVHGIEGMVEGGLIVISAYEDEGLKIRIADNGKGMDKATLEKLQENNKLEEDTIGNHTHLGIHSVDKRIKILYGNEFGVKISSQVMIGTTVDILIPVNMMNEKTED